MVVFEVGMNKNAGESKASQAAGSTIYTSWIIVFSGFAPYIDENILIFYNASPVRRSLSPRKKSASPCSAPFSRGESPNIFRHESLRQIVPFLPCVVVLYFIKLQVFVAEHTLFSELTYCESLVQIFVWFVCNWPQAAVHPRMMMMMIKKLARRQEAGEKKENPKKSF